MRAYGQQTAFAIHAQAFRLNSRSIDLYRNRASRSSVSYLCHAQPTTTKCHRRIMRTNLPRSRHSLTNRFTGRTKLGCRSRITANSRRHSESDRQALTFASQIESHARNSRRVQKVGFVGRTFRKFDKNQSKPVFIDLFAQTQNPRHRQ